MKKILRLCAAVHALRGAAALLAVLICAGASGPAWAQEINPQNYTRITQVPRAEMDAWIKQEVTASGGNWSTDRYHFYIGFSTGHFGQDPVHAIAMRRLAFSLMNNSLAVGDRVTPIAWEMSTWNVGPTINLTEATASRAEFVDRVPYAPHTGSQGGHDIERVLYETITHAIPAEETHSSIVLLLTNSNASQAPTGGRDHLFGADNPLLSEALRKGEFRLPPMRKEFRLQAGAQPVTVAVTALFPQKLTSVSDKPAGPRYPTFARETWQPALDRPIDSEVLPNATRSRPALPPVPAPGIPRWVWIILALAVVAALAAWAMRSRRKPVAPVKSAAPTPQAAPISGSLIVTLGPDEHILKSLTAASRWTLLRTVEGNTTLVADPAPPGATNAGKAPEPETGTPLAKLFFDANRALRVEANPVVQFLDVQGTALSQSTSHLLLIEPGKRALCRILPADTTTKTRFEIFYDIKKGH